MRSNYFQEVQHVRQPWIYILIAVITGIWAWQMVQQVLMGIPFGSNPAPDLVIVITGLIPMGALFLVLSLRLETKVDKEGIHYRMWPFHRAFRDISCEEISHWEVRKYHPIRDYGGWGIRTSFYRRGQAYSIMGNRGVYMEMRDGKKILLGTQREEELRSAMGRMMAGGG